MWVNKPNDAASVQRRIDLVLRHMQAGRLADAEAVCREVWHACPGEAGVCHLLGLLNHQLGKSEAAVDLIQRAISLNPNEAEFHNNLAVALLAVGDSDKSIDAASRAIALRGDYPEALNNLGNAQAAAGRLEKAIEAYDRALERRSDFPEAFNNRGNALRHMGRFDEAIAAYQRAIGQNSNYADAHANLGIALQAIGRLDEAIDSFRLAVALEPGNVRTWNSLGALLFEAGIFDEAMECYTKAISARPSFADSCNSRGLVLQKLGRFEEAIADHRRAVSLKPDFPEALTALGTALRQNGQLDEAIGCYERALALRPEHADAWTFLGAALLEKGDLERGITMHRRAIALRPEHPEAHLNLAFALLAQGNFRDGWPEYEWRRRQKNSSEAQRDFGRPQWHGEDLGGRRILVHAEQGFGDAMQFVRYVPLISGRGGKVVLECYDEMRRLLSGVDGIEQIVSTGKPLPAFDLHCPMLSLPLAFGTTMESIPSQCPYLFPDPMLKEQWAKRVSSPANELKVGLVWAGRAAHMNDRNRSIPLRMIRALAEIRGVRYFSLQKGDSPAHERSDEAGFEIIDWTEELTDFADTAALVANLDLVICVDTAIAHLAGALGKSAWVLLPHPADFRWLLDREDSPWYPTLRLFRQRRAGDWAEPVARVAGELSAMARSSSSSPPR